MLTALELVTWEDAEPFMKQFESLDQNRDGAPDDAALVALLRDRDVAWLAMPTDRRDWERRQLPRLERVLGYDIVIPAWWLDVRSKGPDARGRAVTVERRGAAEPARQRTAHGLGVSGLVGFRVHAYGVVRRTL